MIKVNIVLEMNSLSLLRLFLLFIETTGGGSGLFHASGSRNSRHTSRNLSWWVSGSGCLIYLPRSRSSSCGTKGVKAKGRSTISIIIVII